MRKYLLTSACILLGAGLSSRALFGQGTQSADAAFNQLAEEYIGGYLAWRPPAGTGLGLHQYDGKVTDMSAASIAGELRRLKQFDERLGAVDVNKLGPQASFDCRILHNAVRHEQFSIEELQGFTRNPMTYADAMDVNIYIKRNFAPLEDRVRSITAILNEAPKVMAAARANLAESLARPLIETAIEEANGSADFLGKDLVEALKDFTSEPAKSQFNAANKRAIEALREYANYLKAEKLPKANEKFAIGPENYRKMLQYEEMLSLSPDQVLAIGMKELAHQQQVFAEAARAIDPSKKPTEVFEAIQKDHPTAVNLIPDTAKDMESIRAYLITGKIITVPSEVRVKVEESPQFMRATSFASMDTPGPFETKATEAYYYITPVEAAWPAKQQEEWLEAFNYYTTDVVSIHEAYPGHYIQFLHLNASPATKVEKIFNSYAFVEGWAHYCEQMMIDEGYAGAAEPMAGSDAKVRAAKYRLAQADEALLRLCRLCVSVKMHCQGMTVDEGAKFFQENCYYGEKPARSEAMRGTFDPGYLFYTVGKLEILKLREDYRKQEGANYSLLKFHDALLEHGAPPVRMLREVMLKDPKSWGEVF